MKTADERVPELEEEGMFDCRKRDEEDRMTKGQSLWFGIIVALHRLKMADDKSSKDVCLHTESTMRINFL